MVVVVHVLYAVGFVAEAAVAGVAWPHLGWSGIDDSVARALMMALSRGTWCWERVWCGRREEVDAELEVVSTSTLYHTFTWRGKSLVKLTSESLKARVAVNEPIAFPIRLLVLLTLHLVILWGLGVCSSRITNLNIFRYYMATISSLLIA